MPRKPEFALILERLSLPAHAHVLVMHAVSADPLFELRDLSAGGRVVAIAPTLAEYTALQSALGPKAGEEITVALENLSAPNVAAAFDCALLDTDWPSGRGNSYTRQLIDAMVAQVRDGGSICLQGSNGRGVQTFVRHLRTRCPDVTLVSVGGGKRAYRATRRPSENTETREDDEPRIIAVATGGLRFRLSLQPGVFGAQKLDEATELLIGALALRKRDDVLDLGCGAGAIGIAAALLAPEGKTLLADSNPRAVALAAQNIAVNGVSNALALLSDGYSALAGQRFDVIATNPPFHRHGRESRAVAERFIREAPGHLRSDGHFYLVASAFLPYQRAMAEVFGEVQTLTATPSFKVLLGEKPIDRQC